MEFKSWPKKATNRAFITLIGSALAFSLMTVCIKQLNNRLPVVELVFFRSLFSVLVTRLSIKNIGISPWGMNKSLLLTRGLIGTGALFCFFNAINALPLSIATIIQYTYPTFMTLFAWLILGEKIRKRIFLAIIVGWVGIQLVVNPFGAINLDQQLPLMKVFIALGGAILTALAYVIVRKLSRKEHPLVIVFYFPLVSLPITLPFLIQQAVLPKGIDWVWIVGICVLTQIGQVLITHGLKILPAGYAGSINYTQVLFASLWGLLIFSEPLTIYILIGAACVLAATLISLSDLPNF